VAVLVFLLLFVLGVFVVGVVSRVVPVVGGGVVGVSAGVGFRWSVLSGAFAPAWCRPAVSLWSAVSGVSLPVRAVFGWRCGSGVGLPVSSAPLAVWGVRCGGGVVLFAVSGGFGGCGLARLLWRWRSARRRVSALGRVPRGSSVGSLCWLAGRPSVLVVGGAGGGGFVRRRFAFWGCGRFGC